MRLKSSNRFYFVMITILLVVILFVRVHVFEIVRIDGNSMLPTYNDGDKVLIYKLAVKSSYSNNDVVIIPNPNNKENLLSSLFTHRIIKRIVATEGDTINCLNGILYINSIEINDAFMNISKTKSAKNMLLPCIVESESVFVLGDNRKNSYDSRAFGFVSTSDIQGKAIVKLWPLN